MVDMTALKKAFKADMTSAEFYLSRATPSTMITSNQRRSYQDLLKEALVPLCNARLTLLEIKDNDDPAQRLTSDDLRGLQDQYDELCRKFDDVYKDDDSEPDRQRNQLSQSMTAPDTAHARKREEATHQTKLKMELLLVDVNVLSTAIMKDISPNTLEDFIIMQAMKMHSEWRTQATAITKKLLEVKSSICQ